MLLTNRIWYASHFCDKRERICGGHSPAVVRFSSRQPKRCHVRVYPRSVCGGARSAMGCVVCGKTVVDGSSSVSYYHLLHTAAAASVGLAR